MHKKITNQPATAVSVSVGTSPRIERLHPWALPGWGRPPPAGVTVAPPPLQRCWQPVPKPENLVGVCDTYFSDSGVRGHAVTEQAESFFFKKNKKKSSPAFTWEVNERSARRTRVAVLCDCSLIQKGLRVALSIFKLPWKMHFRLFCLSIKLLPDSGQGGD